MVKLTVEQRGLNDALKRVLPAISKNTSMPILKFVKLTAKGDMLHLETTDLAIGIQTKIEADVEIEGSIAVPVQLLQKYINKLKKDVKIEVVDNEFKIKSGRSRTTISCASAEEFPVTPVDKGERVEFDQERLKYMLERTVFATSDNESQPFLCGVLLTTQDGKLSTVATDTYRLPFLQQEVEFDKELDIILPTQTCSVLIKELNDGDASFLLSDNTIVFELDDTKIVSRIIEGSFPDYKRVIPQNNKIQVTVDSGELANAIDRALLLSDDNIVLFNAGDVITITNTNDGRGQTEEKVECNSNGELQTAFNGNYFLDYLKKVDEEIIISGDGNLSPIKVEKDGYIYMLMPTRVK